MKRLVVAVLGVLVAAPAWAGGHFEPHSMVAPSVNGLTHVWRPSEAISPPDALRIFRPSEAISPPDSFRHPDEAISPPVAYRVGLPSEAISPPDSYRIPSEAISPPDLALGPLVKPVWKD